MTDEVAWHKGELERVTAEREAIKAQLADVTRQHNHCSARLAAVHRELDAVMVAREGDERRHRDELAAAKRAFEARYRQIEQRCIDAQNQANRQYELIGKRERKCRDSIRALSDARTAVVSLQATEMALRRAVQSLEERNGEHGRTISALRQQVDQLRKHADQLRHQALSDAAVAAGALCDEKKRADDAVAELNQVRALLEKSEKDYQTIEWREIELSGDLHALKTQVLPPLRQELERLRPEVERLHGVESERDRLREDCRQFEARALAAEPRVREADNYKDYKKRVHELVELKYPLLFALFQYHQLGGGTWPQAVVEVGQLF